MANRCQCPPVACRGVFKYLTYLIPIRECSQHPGPGIVYRGFVKLKKGASVAHYYITSIPLGSVATHLHNGIYLISIILDAIIYKCTFFLNVVKPPLERFILYLNTYYVSSLAEDSVEETKSEVSGDKLSKSYSKLAKSETLSSKSVDSAKTVATAKSVDSAKTGATAKTVDSAKTGATAKSVDSAKTGATAKSESLTKTGSAVKSEGPAMTENNLKSEGSTKSGSTHKSAPPQLRSPFDFDYEVDFEPDDSISGSEEVKIEQIKVEQSTVESNTVEPVGAAEPGTAESGTAESGTAESGTAEPEIELTPPVQRRHRRSLPRRLVTCVFKPVRYAFHGMVDILKGTKDNFVHAGSCTYNYLASCPLWIYLYVIFVSLTVSYIVYETYITYKCRIWLQATKLPAQIREGCKEFILPDTTLKQVMAKLRTEIDKGLNPKTKASSSVKCFTTYVQDLPTGEENGKFLALDLGGTNFRVLLITLNGRHFDMQSKIYVIPQDVMVGTSQNLFNHIAVCLADFTVEHRVSKDNLPLGFTFSFPLKQEGLSKGILQRWTKGFNCPEAIGKDVVEQLRDAIEAHGDLHIDIMAILNDTTGTLMSCAWKNHNTKIGVILGTGTNACYVEKIENVIDFDGDKSKPYVLINTEWGAFGDNGELEFIRTSYDKEVDNKSINPGMQIHEKLISGMYLGEIVRLLLVKFISDNLIFNGKLTEEIQQSGHIPTKFLSEVESDKRGCFKECKKALAKLGYNQVTDEDCNSVRFVCECVSRRAAHLASAALATIINKMGHTSLTIGVDGSLYRYHPHFHDLMVQKISQLIDEKIMNVNLMLSEDGSGRGAALVAASLY